MSVCEFKVGDIIVNDNDRGYYSITCSSNGFVGEVISINTESKNNIVVKVLESNDGSEGHTYPVNSKYFLLKESPKKKYEFRKGDKVRRIVRDYGCKVKVGMFGIVTQDYFSDEDTMCSFHVKMDGLEEDTYQVKFFELVESSDKNFDKNSSKKLIEKETNKMDLEEIKKIDKSILLKAKEQVELERAEKQQKEAEAFLRQLLEQKDDAEKVVKSVGIDLEEIENQLKIFDTKTNKTKK